jgi:prevent-host-death family protein
MIETISASEANRNFSALLRGSRQGIVYRITSHGNTIARLVPADQSNPGAETVRKQLLAELLEGPGYDIVPWTRDELYDE